jgi:hypothetical protein
VTTTALVIGLAACWLISIVLMLVAMARAERHDDWD